jgi:hypothetical protein
MAALPDAWIYYRSPKPHSRLAFAAEYQLQCHLDSPITFLGVWDTVGSLGIPGSLLAAGNKEKFAFHDTNPLAAREARRPGAGDRRAPARLYADILDRSYPSQRSAPTASGCRERSQHAEFQDLHAPKTSPSCDLPMR